MGDVPPSAGESPATHGRAPMRAGMGAQNDAGRITLSREFSALLVELSIALHKHAMYPSGHPSLGPAAAAVEHRAARLLDERPRIAIGVARRQLIIEGVATDPDQPVLRRLAESLHRHRLGALTIARGVEPAEIGEALRTLAAEPDRDGAIGMLPADQRPAWPHIRLHPLTFDRLSLMPDDPDGPGSRGRGAELWIGLARAALAGDDAAPQPAVLDPSAAMTAEPAAVARAIDAHPRAEAYDQVIVGYLLQIASELREASAADVPMLRRRTARLIAALNPTTLRRLVRMSGNAAQRNAFVRDATQGMAVDAVVEIVKAASDVTGQTISHGLLRMLTKLASHAEQGTDRARPLADAALRQQVQRLLADWQLADPNPAEYARLLQRVTNRAPRAGNGSRDDALDGAAEPIRVLQMCLEVGGGGPLVERALDEAIRNGGIAPVLQLIAAAPPSASRAADAMLERLLHGDTLAALLRREPLDVESLDRLLPLLPAGAYAVLLDALATSESRATRRKLLDRLARAPMDLGPHIVARLTDDRWFVQRNLLVLLERTGRVPEGFSAMPWVSHPDQRVRMQAIRVQLMLPAERGEALRAALDDQDPRLVRIGLAAVDRSCPPEAAARVAAIAGDEHADPDLRVLAVRALGTCATPDGLETLLRIVDGGRSFWRRPRLAPRTPLVIAALQVLGHCWAAEPRAAAMLALAETSGDLELRQGAACHE